MNIMGVRSDKRYCIGRTGKGGRAVKNKRGREGCSTVIGEKIPILSSSSYNERMIVYEGERKEPLCLFMKIPMPVHSIFLCIGGIMTTSVTLKEGK